MIATVETAGLGQPATLAWLITNSSKALPAARFLWQSAADTGLLNVRSKGVLLAALCELDLDALAPL